MVEFVFCIAGCTEVRNGMVDRASPLDRFPHDLLMEGSHYFLSRKSDNNATSLSLDESFIPRSIRLHFLPSPSRNKEEEERRE